MLPDHPPPQPQRIQETPSQTKTNPAQSVQGAKVENAGVGHSLPNVNIARGHRGIWLETQILIKQVQSGLTRSDRRC